MAREKAPETYEEKLAQLERAAVTTPCRGPRPPSRSSTPGASTRRASGSRSCSTPAPSRSSTPSCATATHEFDMEKNRPLGRRRRHRPRHDRRPPRVRVLPGLHGLRRLAGRGHGREDGQGHGPGGQDRLPGHRHQRLRRRADPGGRRLARRLRRRVRPQRHVLGRDPADLADHGPVRGRRGLLPRDDRLHLHGEGDLAHVHHRPRRDQDGHRRGGRLRGARRRDEPTTRSPASPTSPPTTRTSASRTPATSSRSCPRTTSRRAPRVLPSDDPMRMDEELDHVVPDNAEQAVRHARRRPLRRRRRRVLRGPRALRARTSSAASRGSNGYAVGIVGNQPRPAGRRARHRLLREGRAVRAHLRRVQHPDPDLLRRPRLPARHLAGVGRDHPPRRRSCSTPTPRRRCRRSP